MHGGYGYTRDYPVECLYRDNRLNAIPEGTKGIQALDLLGRKVRQEDGAAKAVVGPFPVVEVLPLGELVFQGWISKVDSWPELLERRFLDPLNLAVEMR